MVERKVVDLEVAGSIPVNHPKQTTSEANNASLPRSWNQLEIFLVF